MPPTTRKRKLHQMTNPESFENKPGKKTKMNQAFEHDLSKLDNTKIRISIPIRQGEISKDNDGAVNSASDGKKQEVADVDSDYEEFKEGVKKTVKARKTYTIQKWKMHSIVNETYLEKYLDNLLRQKQWLYKIDYSRDKYTVLKCLEGPCCPYKRKVNIEEVKPELEPNHVMYELTQTIFEGTYHKLTIEENEEAHRGHYTNIEIEEKYRERIKGCSEFVKIIVKKIKLHLEKHTKRIKDLKRILGNDYDFHVPSSTTLANYCYTVRRQDFLKDFNNSLGSFQDLKNQYSIEKAEDETSLIILGINEELENFTLVFSCKHYLQHFQRQTETSQPPFLCSDTTFSLMQNNYKLIVIGTESPSHNFRFGCLALSLHENEESYKFDFNILKETLAKMYNFSLEPKFSMSDAQKGQLNALKAVFPGIKKLRCLFHLMQNIERKLRAAKLMDKSKYIQWVTSKLREAMNEQEFLSTWELLKSEVLQMTNQEFVKSYEQDYVKSEALWYQGASFIGKQKTNNSLESINRYLKDNWTERSSRTVPEFIEIMKSSFQYYLDKCKEKSCMPKETTNLKKYFHKAELVIENKIMYQINDSLYGFIRIPKKHKKNPETRAVGLAKRLEKLEERLQFAKDHIHAKFQNLITFTKIHDFFWFYNFRTQACSCKTFNDRGVCKHNLATLLKLKKIENPYCKLIQPGSQVGRPANLMRG